MELPKITRIKLDLRKPLSEEGGLKRKRIIEAQRLLRNKTPTKEIAKLTGLPHEETLGLRNGINNVRIEAMNLERELQKKHGRPLHEMEKELVIDYLNKEAMNPHESRKIKTALDVDLPHSNLSNEFFETFYDLLERTEEAQRTRSRAVPDAHKVLFVFMAKHGIGMTKQNAEDVAKHAGISRTTASEYERTFSNRLKQRLAKIKSEDATR